MGQADRDKWNDRYRQPAESAAPAPFLLSLQDILPRQGQALDVAGGSGRNALWLATRGEKGVRNRLCEAPAGPFRQSVPDPFFSGLQVTLADISSEGLELAAERAAELGLPLKTLEIDFEIEPLPPGPWDLIVQFCYLERDLFPQFFHVLAPGGLLVISQPTMQNLTRHAKPPAEFLLREGELRELVRGLEIVRYEEGWQAEGRHEASVAARKFDTTQR